MIRNYLVYTKWYLGNRTINIYNLNNGKEVMINATDVSVPFNIVATSFSENYIGINILGELSYSSWNLYVLDISFINWTAITTTVTYNWNYLEDYLIPIDINQNYDVYGSNIHKKIIVYNRYFTTRTASLSNIITYNFNDNTEKTIGLYISAQTMPDIYNDIVVWMDNRNTLNPLTNSQTINYKDNFNIYRTKSLTETIPNIFISMLPIFMIGGVFVIVGIAAKSFAGGFF